MAGASFFAKARKEEAADEKGGWGHLEGDRAPGSLARKTEDLRVSSTDVAFGGNGSGQSASFGYDNNGNLTSVTGDLLGVWSLTYDDANRPTLINYPGGSDIVLYNSSGQRMPANLNGTIYRYVYNGDRVLEQTNDAGDLLTRYTAASGSYYGPLLSAEYSDGSVRCPLSDLIGTSRRLVDASGVATDAYSLDAFGRSMGGWGTTANPYRYGATWGYITDAQGSGLLQLGPRYYWPELGRFIQQDPIGAGRNRYAYVGGEPNIRTDPSGQVFVVDNVIGAIASAGFGAIGAYTGAVAAGGSRRDIVVSVVIGTLTGGAIGGLVGGPSPLLGTGANGGVGALGDYIGQGVTTALGGGGWGGFLHPDTRSILINGITSGAGDLLRTSPVWGALQPGFEGASPVIGGIAGSLVGFAISAAGVPICASLEAR